MPKPTFFLAVVLVLNACGCEQHAREDATAPPSLMPSTRAATLPISLTLPQAVTHSPTGLSFSVPQEFERVLPGDLAFLFRCRDGEGRSLTISLDVPALPPHVPGWIPMGMVRKGFIDDVAEQHSGAKSSVLPSPAVAGGSTSLVRSEWPTAEGPWVEFARLIVRKDTVYILRVSGPLSCETSINPITDGIFRSLSWGVGK